MIFIVDMIIPLIEIMLLESDGCSAGNFVSLLQILLYSCPPWNSLLDSIDSLRWSRNRKRYKLSQPRWRLARSTINGR